MNGNSGVVPVLYPGCLDDMRRGGAIIEGGHFVNGQGRHGSIWVDMSAVTVRPKFVEHCVQALDQGDFRGTRVVTGPSYGANALCQSLAYYLEAPFAIPIEKRSTGGKTEWGVRPLFHRHLQEAAEKGGIVLCDDVLHTGSTLKVALNIFSAIIPKESIRGVAVILNRGDFTDVFEGLPLRALVSQRFPEYEARWCPLCKKRVPIRTDFGVGTRFLEELVHGGRKKQARQLGWNGKS